MRSRQWIWILLCLLIAAGTWFCFRPQGQHPFSHTKAKPSAAGPSATAVSQAPPLTILSTNNVQAAAAERARAIQTRYRLSNTTKTLGELVNDRHAILLANALIDTTAGLNLSIPKELQAPGDPGAYIVQANGPINNAFRAMLAASGAQIVSYIPNNAYLVTMAKSVADELAAGGLPVVPYEPYYKVSASLLPWVGKSLPADATLNVELFPGSEKTAIPIIEAAGGKVLSQEESANGLILNVQPPADWTAIPALPIAHIVEPSHRRVPANDLSRATVGVAADTQVISNYLNLSGSNVLVEVNDSGIDMMHPDFSEDHAIASRVSGDLPASLVDTSGHGTHVAGIIAGDGTESMTVANAQGSIMPATTNQFRGMAPDAMLYSVGFLSGDDTNFVSDLYLQETPALTNALISNNSWNYGGDSDYDLAAASYDAAVRDALPFATGSQPVLFVFSAGNEGNGDDTTDPGSGSPDSIDSPGTAKNVITVGSIQEFRNITNEVTNADGTVSTPWQNETSTSYRIAGFSSRGNVGIDTEGTFGRFKPDVVAPGTFIISTRSEQWDLYSYFYSSPTNYNLRDFSVIVQSDTLAAARFPQIPPNTVGLTIQLFPNPRSPVPMPDLPIYYALVGSPAYTWVETNEVLIPPDPPGIATILSSEGTYGFNYAVSNVTSEPINFDIVLDTITTNNPGNLELVYSNLDQSLGTNNPANTVPGPYYRYETGTSMSAADVSGVLALMQDFFTNTLRTTPSPALLKAMLINGARPGGPYDLNVQNNINFEGWGLVNLPDSVPPGLTNQLNQPCAEFIVDQSPTNALATGDSQTYTVTLTDTNPVAQTLPLRVTLAWTDPPGDPAAAIKLVNNLDLVVSNLDDPANPLIFYGNDIAEGSDFNTPHGGTNATASFDAINNVENVYIAQPLGTNYSITVIGRDVNVNADTAQTNNVVQDYALVVSCGEGEVANAMTVTAGATSFVSNPTGDQQITYITTTNTPLLNQIVGANTPLLGTNTLPLGPDTIWSTNGQMTAGMTNQWHFYVVTNNALDNSGSSSDVTNAAFITFLPSTLAIPRMGVLADATADATRPEADIDLYVSTDPSLMDLNPVVLSNCLNGAQIGLSVGTPPVFNAASLGPGGTEFVVDTNSTPGQIYYVGVKSEDQMGSEYNFLSVFTATPFSQMQNGNQLVNGLTLPAGIPDGSPAHPGIVYIFGLALYPMQVGQVVVNDAIVHQNFGDLIGTLNHNGIRDVLNNHDSLGSPPGPYNFIYDDFPSLTSHLSDGPGSLLDFVGTEAIGPWMLVEADTSPTQIGYVSNYNLTITPHQDLTHGINVTIQPGSWFYDYIDVPVGYMELILSATNTTTPFDTANPIQMYEKFGNPPTATAYDQEVLLTNCLTGTWPTGSLPGNSISTGPPLPAGFYYVGLFNPSASAQNVYIIAELIPVPVPATFVTNGPAVAIPDDAVTDSSIFINNKQQITGLNISLIVTNARISDLAFTLVSPTGQRILLMENRGGTTAGSLGHADVITNFFGTQTAGGATASTNVLGPVGTSGTLLINYDFYSVPDTMDVYYQGVDIFSSGPVSNSGQFVIPFGPGLATNLVIVMNQGNNTNSTTAWEYTPSVVNLDYTYVTFTQDTNLTQIPIKFAIPPYDAGDNGTNYTLCNFELATNGDYFGFTNIYDDQGGWTVPTNLVTLTTVLTNASLLVTNVVVLTNNEVSVVADPATAEGGTNYLALANGVITRTIPVTVGRQYSVSYAYRGPGIGGWWRGEGNANDSSDPENFGNNGSLIGRFDFPAGEVGQAFQMEVVGQPYGFAGTNTYVQIRQAPFLELVNTNGVGNDTNLVLMQTTPLDVGMGSGFTVEGWINPTNVLGAEPLVEWLARVPTNGADTNLIIEAGPFLDRDTGHYYYLLGSTNWTTSEIWATQLGGHLVTLDTANEQNWVYDTFAQYGGVNRNLWIGLTNYTANPTNFAWSGGLTNVTYFNWAPGEPTNCSGNDFYTAILGPTNAYPGLWVLEDNAGTDNNGVNCGAPPTNNIYGVVEVTNLQPNGVQIWISVTNSPGTTNLLVSSNGCLYANLVDTTNGSHEIYSAPGLIQSNLYQHIALTYNTNTGIAALYYNGATVASTNLGVFVPKTTGDLLLGKDMSRLTNNFYTGKMDEMSIYRRFLSDAEIAAIYNISALSTNRNVGKFDPGITPPLSLAEAQVSLSTVGTNLVLGENTNWLVQGFTFTAATNSLQLQIAGLEPGLLLDSFGVAEASQGNLYYLPETSLDALNGDSAYGTWTLEIWDSRTGGVVTNAQLVSWQIQFTMQTNVPITLNADTSSMNTVPPGATTYYAVSVPIWATLASNILVSATRPVNLLFNQTNPPTGSNPGDYTFLTASTGGSYLMTTNPVPAPQLLPGQTYYLGVQNPNAQSATVVVEVDFDITALTNGVPLSGVLTTNAIGVEQYYAFDVTSNATEATFQLLKLSSNADLVVSQGMPLPTLTSSDYGSFNVSNVDENIYVLTNSSPVPLSAGRWYLGVFRRDPGPVQYSILAKELDPPLPNIIVLTNDVPFTFTAGPGAALANFFKFTVTNTITSSVTNLVGSIHFELYYMNGDGDLTVATDAPPLAPPFFQSSQEPGLTPEVILIHTNTALTNLATDWYLGVPNHEITNISYTILAGIDTNLVFPAFPGAEGAQGAGAGALGGRGGDVYHVVNLNDDGPGSLRYGIDTFVGTGAATPPGTGTTNISGSVSNFFGARTIVFDVSGTINLLSPLVITNSYLTIAGQSAPCGGITVAGQMTTLQSAHDVVIRDLRFRRGRADDSLQFTNVANVIADHVSAEWTSDNLISVLNSSNVTVQWSILADSLYITNNPPPTGSLLRYGGGALSFHHNLYADNYSGNPYLQDNLSLDFVNNVIYNWGIASGSSGTNDPLADPNGLTNQLNYVGNYLIAGPDTAFYSTNAAQTNYAFYGGITNTWVFQTNNFIDSDTNGILNGANTDWAMFTNYFTEFGRAFPLPPVAVDETFVAYEKVLDFAGVNLCKRDAVDTNIVTKVRTQTGTLISYPPLGGMVAWWKGEGNAVDSAGANNGTLVGSIGFAPGEVGQAFNFKDTNGYVFVPASPQLNVGVDSGFTIEEWINPSNASTQMPLLGWGSNTVPNASVLAGPILNTNNGHYYYLLQTNTWTVSEAFAQRLGGYLATVRNAGENNWISNMFINFGGAPRNLWIGFYDPSQDVGGGHVNNFVWVDGEPVTYTYWASGEPNKGCGNEYYTFMFSSDFAPNTAGWNDADNSADRCPPPGVTPAYGVVEVAAMPGAQLWTSVTWPGGGGAGCLYANLVDTANGSHQFSSSPGLIHSNVYQHVALTYSTNSGIATLYLNGAIVASTNLGIFVPMTTGGVLLGRRDNGVSTDTYLGGMDEVTIYKRVLSQTEIRAIYQAGSAGKFAVAAPMLPYLDTDHDGIPDFWEITFGQNPTNASNNQLSTNPNYIGYSDLEEYLNWLAMPHALTVTNTPVGVDLYLLSGNSGRLSFSVTNPVNGTVYLTNVLGSVTNTGPFSNSIAIFTPATDYSGYASFDYFVTNNDTVAYFGPVTVSVVVSAVPIVYATNLFNSPPMLATNLPDLTNNELTTLTVTNTATDTNAGVTLTYTVTMAIDTNAMIANGWPLTYATTIPAPVIDANGIITWTPSESQGPGVYIITTVVSDNGIPPGTAANSFIVTVEEVNTAPVLPAQTNLTIGALTTLIVTNTATDSDIPPNPLTYQLIGPLGAVIDTNGIITWTPTLAQAPGVYTFTTIVTDTNQYALFNQSLSATNVFTVSVFITGAPFVFTQPAQAVTGNSAQLNGMATPNGLPTTAWFEWGTNTLYGNQTPPVGVGAGYNVVYTTNLIGGLVLNVPYHFRLVASNTVGVVYGFDQILDEANVVVWGADYAKQAEVPAGLSNVVAIAGAYDHSLALKNNETAVGWGDNTFGQGTVPAGVNNNLLAIAGGAYYSIALKNNGTVASWGANILGQTNVPAGLNNVVEIAGGTYSSLALQNNGNVVAWGAGFFNLTNVPAGLNNVVAIAGGSYHSLAIRNDGTVVAWGDDSANQTNVPAGLTNVVAIAGGGYHSLALKYDGTVVAWGDDSAGQTDVPASLSNVVAVAAGGFHSLALKNDGTVVAWGDNTAGQKSVPVGLTNMVAVAGGYLHSLALTPQSIASLTNIVLNLTNGVPQTNTIVPGGITYYQVNVPTNADFATNLLLYADNGPLNVWFGTNAPPTTNVFLFSGTNGSYTLSTNGTPPLVPGSTYYLGVQNTNSSAVNYGIEVDFHLVTVPILISTITYTNGGFLLTWYAPTNDEFLVQWTGGLTPPLTWTSFSNIVTYTSLTPTNGIGFFEYFDDGTQFPLGPVRFYRLQLLQSLSGGVPQTNSVPANGIDYFMINVPVNADLATNLLLAATGPLNLLFNQSALPTGTNAGDYTLLAGVTNGSSVLSTTSVPTNIVPGGTYWLGVQNTNNFAVTFSIGVNFHLTAASLSISSITFTNLGGTNGFLLRWFAPTNDVFQVLRTDTLSPANWQFFTNFIYYIGPPTPANGLFSFFDDGSQTPPGLPPTRFYRIVLVGSNPSTHTNAVSISSVTSTNIAGTNSVWLTWSAPTNYLFEMQWTTNLMPVVTWHTSPNIMAYSTFVSPTNSLFNFFDNGSQGGLSPIKFYRLILLP